MAWWLTGSARLESGCEMRTAKWLIVIVGIILTGAWADSGLAVGRRDTLDRLEAARAARRDGEYDLAEAYLKEFESKRGPTSASKLERDLLQVQQGNLDSVPKSLQAAVDKSNKTTAPLVLEALTRGYLEAYQPADAKRYFKIWLEHQWNDAQGWYVRGWARERLAQFEPRKQWSQRYPPECPEEALQDYRRAVAIDPKHQQARLRLGEVLLDKNEVKEAVTHFEELHKRQPDNQAVAVGLARCRLLMADESAAQRLLDTLLEKHPRCAAAWSARGNLQMRLGRLDQAQASLRKALALAPSDREANYHLSQCMALMGKQEQAQECRARLKRIEEDSVRLSLIFEQLITKPKSADLRCAAGAILLRLDQEKEGLRLLDLVLKADPKHRPAHQELAAYYERIGKKDLAAKHRKLAGK
jgi:tetratricopeptide (TPR) repeat protein